MSTDQIVVLGAIFVLGFIMGTIIGQIAGRE